MGKEAIHIDNLITAFVEENEVDLAIVLLQIIAHPSQGGGGYKLEFSDPLFIFDWDGWEVDHENRIISIEVDHSDSKKARFLKEAIEVEFTKSKTLFLKRLGWGAAKIVTGTAEGIIGFVGIIIPEPGTTVGGAVLLGLGTNTFVDGVTQISGVNQGQGFNLLSSSFGIIGKKAAQLGGFNPEMGRMIGEATFLVSSITLGSLASIKIIKAPGKAILSKGVGGQPGGLQVGRFDIMYKSESAMDGLTIFSINNNAGKSILRVVTHNKKIMINGRIYATPYGRVLDHIHIKKNPKAFFSGLLKLMAHGRKF